MTVYFFEGINGIGKSTLIRAFPNDVIKELFDERQELKLTGQPRIKAVWDSSIELYNMYAHLKRPVLINRSFLSEIVYSEVLSREYSLADMQVLEYQWNKYDAKIIYLKRDFPIEVVLQRRPQFEKTFLLEIEKTYEKYLKEIFFNVIIISVKEDVSEAFKILKKIIK